MLTLKHIRKRHLYEVRPDIEEVGRDADHVLEVPHQALDQAWLRIKEDLMDGLVRVLKKRVKAVIAAE